MASSFAFERHATGTVIIKQGDKGNKFYILKDGTARARKWAS